MFYEEAPYGFLDEDLRQTQNCALVSLCQRTNCNCDNSPTLVLQNLVSVARHFAVQKLVKNCDIDSLFFDKVKPPQTLS